MKMIDLVRECLEINDVDLFFEKRRKLVFHDFISLSEKEMDAEERDLMCLSDTEEQAKKLVDFGFAEAQEVVDLIEKLRDKTIAFYEEMTYDEVEEKITDIAKFLPIYRKDYLESLDRD